MSNPSAFGSLCHEAESSWAEDTDTTTTLAHPLVAPLQLSLTHNKLAPEGVYQYRNQGSDYILGGIGGSFTATYDLYGHGSTMVGSPSLTQYETYLGRIWGNVALSASASDTATGGTASVPTMTGATGFSAGSLCSFGALADADGDAQVYPIATHSSNNLTLLAALRAAPANGAVVRPVAMVYPSSSPTSTSITGTRFRWQSANLQYLMHGCFPTAVTLSGLNPGARPQVSVTWGVSWWEYKADTFPNTVTAERSTPATNNAGSLHVQTVATVTRNEVSCREFSVTYQMNTIPLMGPAGVNAYQTIIGAVRGNDTITVEWIQDSDAASTSPATPALGTASNRKHVMWTGNTIDGKQLSIWLPNVCITTVPIQFDNGGLNSLRVTGKAETTATTTTALTLAPFVLGFS